MKSIEASGRPYSDTIQEDAEVIRRVRRGDGEAFRCIVQRYQGRVYGFARKMLNNHHDAEDVCQEAFVRAYTYLERFDTRYPFSNWVLTITANLCKRFLKRRRKLHVLPDYGLAAAETPDGSETEENVSVLHREVSKAIAGLSEQKRTALVLLQQSSQSYAEIADIMDVPIGTVKTTIHRARNAIRSHLAAKGLLE